MISCVTGKRLKPLDYGAVLLRTGVNDGARTRGLSGHNRVLYQLSYNHHYNFGGEEGVEPPTNRGRVCVDCSTN